MNTLKVHGMFMVTKGFWKKFGRIIGDILSFDIFWG